MSQTLIQYRGFWDVPRIFLARHQGQTYLFDCPFSEDLDDYPDVFKVYLIPDLTDVELPKDWTTLPKKAIRYLGEIPVAHVRFDPTRRQSIDSSIFEELAVGRLATG